MSAILPGELDVDNACLAALKHDVLELLNVPLVLREDCKDMGEDTDLVIMADNHFVEGFAVRFTVHAVLVVDGTGGTELLDNADGLFTDGGF